jgi:uncharacterized membrane protein
MILTEKIKIIGSVCATSGMIILYFIFIAAYAFGDNITCININNYNEATFELIFIHIQLILSILGTVFIILFRERKKNEKTPAHNLASV